MDEYDDFDFIPLLADSMLVALLVALCLALILSPLIFYWR